MTLKSRMLLTILINLSLLAVFAVSLFFAGNTWQQKSELEAKDKKREFYFSKVENHLNDVVTFISFISDQYAGDCSRHLV